MKKFLAIILLISFIFSSGTLMAGDKPKADSPVAVLMKVVKEVTLKKENKDWTEAKTGVPLLTNDEIKTGPKSLAMIKFTDNSIVRVRENSNLKIYADKKNQALSKNVYMDKGKLGAEISKQENDEFKFSTPTMVASIRGTTIAIETDDTSTTLVCNTGEVGIEATQGLKENATINGGQYANINSNGQIITGNNGTQQNNLYNSTTSVNTRKLKIVTNQGTIIIEYPVND